MERELEISCMFVGAENAIEFIVCIDANRYIDQLKKAIKSECEHTVTCDANELQLYLAKKDDVWLNVASAMALTPEELPATFQKLNPLRKLSSVECFGAEEHKQLKEDEIRVLVALPARATGDTEGTLMKRKFEEYELFVQQKRKRYVHSEMNSSKGGALRQDLNLRVVNLTTSPPPAGHSPSPTIPPFNWERVVNEDGKQITLTEEQQRDRYRKYVETNIGEHLLAENQLCVFGVEKGKNILTAQVPGHNIDLVGRTDLLILNSMVQTHAASLAILPNVKMLIEVKREVESRAVEQTLSELIALDLLATQPVLALLTDLRGEWMFFWISGKLSRSQGTTIETVTLSQPDEAFEAIRAVLAWSPDAVNSDEGVCIPRVQDRVKLQKLKDTLITITEASEGGEIRESIERYYDIASILGPDIEMARAVANQVVRAIPPFGMYM